VSLQEPFGLGYLEVPASSLSRLRTLLDGAVSSSSGSNNDSISDGSNNKNDNNNNSNNNTSNKNDNNTSNNNNSNNRPLFGLEVVGVAASPQGFARPLLRLPGEIAKKLEIQPSQNNSNNNKNKNNNNNNKKSAQIELPQMGWVVNGSVLQSSCKWMLPGPVCEEVPGMLVAVDSPPCR
ncbi:unnamed protein product, partial [Polarella glacialis]